MEFFDRYISRLRTSLSWGIDEEEIFLAFKEDEPTLTRGDFFLLLEAAKILDKDGV